MIHTSRQVKDLIRNQSKGNSAKAQILLRIYMMERFLERMSLSDYNKNFILKGGMLVSSMVGIDMRSTMDIDTTLKNIPLSEESVKSIIEHITAIKLDDNINFRIKSVSEIMDEAEYGGIRVSLEAALDMMRVPLKIDISTGDVITPREIEYEMPLMFENRKIAVLAYNTETLLAEKLETVIARGTANTRLRDFYDIYIILNNSVYEINSDNFSLAFHSTCKKRGSDTLINNAELIINEIEADENMQNLWRAYRHKFEYAKDISWDMVIESVKQLLHMEYRNI
ncbi:MAG: nucleotidyl transferase AbiEii/AbiGii toxin family protein [bacterium]|nr:nucleotidyl transferase AbiEii/AbiGii toxin family protein [bacterium]